MSKGPEANFWNTIRKSLPTKAFATRIENKHGGGVPDVHIVWNGFAFWIELKTAKSSKVKISPHQIAWHTAYWARGGKSFYLVKHLSTSDIFLFEGEKGVDLLEKGIFETEGSRFKNLAPLWEFLAPLAPQ